ncbi:succinate dehydrogenase cytochrome b subunit [Roseivirga sp.]|jgi:succinate dehydrogenase / fumarate reductase cytochrome b subunit|uniref:succinate dehydrogenase cytochrome b subunit n=1 Tax=Roseivirga sp. TaxID=1964215 RepID=UPI000D794515|nr:succinate dehydrogenase cytochrome b subunit [Roseivirga sp.]PWL27418.1 MAG: succinate dehydrogenase [Roseivirga sp. XM-24bin3]MBO6494950.1 succinate dehydrogenase cytochrome b subunit [Roseivirga sp.]MBO6661881.1 succinate dehydrogenase cytochrome b subunit [Roseivirga sp.]MBO6761733.1 succinate dehydrogenase cytochrome b subunit [Roseivirga sp.]MBO6909530.1 succinate dehydrogenase cytochrome b subunit [Roseivirga sp.]
MSWVKNTFSSSIGRKFAMALSALFLMIFLLQHFVINFTSVFSETVFNDISHFMGTNALVQFALQPVLIFAVVYHFAMGFALEIKNRNSREVKYAMNKGQANSSWFSRNMIISGAVILAFLGLHFYDFWVPEITTKYIEGDMSGMINGEYRYYHEMVEKFHDPVRVGIYSLSFVLLAMHLMHGFQSAFQSMGARHPKYTPGIKKFGNIYAILIPAGFIFIALYHHLTSH